MNTKKVEISIVFLVVGLFCVFFLSMWGMNILFAKISDENQAMYWTELFKIMFSSLLSAGVAYCVSYLQTKGAIMREKEKELSANDKRIKLLILEIKDNLDVMDKVNAANFPTASKIILENQISKKILNTYFDKLILEEDVLESLIKYDKKLSLLIGSDLEQKRGIYSNLKFEIKSLITKLEREILRT
ncbi:hypothetical protein ACKVMU_06200 [Enterococcus mundtii]|uniref:Uncharacterized protein n=1 Tax=Enterococcus mundtii TaxID=53346 RepID=A0A848N1G4_ENTMU|nr:hypothetical protein [Enterococcus mundtii]NMP59871.1 hypothetical protein [Enterococcus mundtii]